MSTHRLTVVLTHPVQYFSPWFRWIAAHRPEIELQVVYAVEPTPEQQGAGFGRPFAWDVPLREGYRSTVLRAGRAGDDLGTGTFRGLDVPEMAERVVADRPDAVLVPGWNSITLTRVLDACRRAGIPALYRGDSTLDVAHRGVSRIGWHLATRWRLGRYSAWLSVGTKAREYLLAHGVPPTSIFASPHGLDAQAFSRAAAPFREVEARAAVRREWGLGPADFAVLFVGKLIPIKRPLDLVAAVARLGTGAALVVAGSGPLEAEVGAAAEAAGVWWVNLGFVNQSDLPRVYAAADVLALPSASETWGFAAHEALASGTPVVATSTVGAAPDLVVPGDSGEVVAPAQPAALAQGLAAIREGLGAGSYDPPACRRAVAGNSFSAASVGLLAALERVARPTRRVLAIGSGLVVYGGLERQTFAALSALRSAGAAVHVTVNDWQNRAIARPAEGAGFTWEATRFRVDLDRHTRNPLRLARMLWDVTRANADLLRVVRRFRPTAVLVPEETSGVRNLPVLAGLRALGRPVILRVGNAPLEGRFQRFLWSRVLPLAVSRLVANSEFGLRRLLEVGVPKDRTELVFNAVAPRTGGSSDDPLVLACRTHRTILVVGQIAPFKGTDLAIQAFQTLRSEGRADLRLVVVGRWPDWPEPLVRWAEELRARAGEGVVFAGPREDVPELMAAATVLAAPIVQEETFGNVVLEARNAGLPAVVFPRGGLPELVVHRETGWICAGTEVEDLVAGLRPFLDDPAERARASNAALARAARPDDPYRPERFAARWLEILG